MAGTRGHEGMGAIFLDPCYCQDPRLLGASVLGEGCRSRAARGRVGPTCVLSVMDSLQLSLCKTDVVAFTKQGSGEVRLKTIDLEQCPSIKMSQNRRRVMQ